MSESDPKKPQVAETLVGLPQVPAGSGETQVGLDTVPTDPGMPGPATNGNTEPSLPQVGTFVGEPPTQRPARNATTDENPAHAPAESTDETPAHAGAESTAETPALPARRPSRLAVPAQGGVVPDAAPPRRASRLAVPAQGGVVPDAAPPRRASRIAVPAQGGVVPDAAPPRRASRIAVPAQGEPSREGPTRIGAEPSVASPRRASRLAVPAATPGFEDVTTQPAPGQPLEAQPTHPKLTPPAPTFEWTLPRVAGLAGAVALVGVLSWIFWPSAPPPRPRVAAPSAPVPLAEPPAPKPAPIAAAQTPPPPAAPDRPHLSLDAKTHVLDPLGMHAPDLELDDTHKYRLRLQRDDAKLGTVLARLEESGGWGTLRKMASHAALQFGGARTLRLHCEPGKSFTDADTYPLELVDLASGRAVEFQIFPARHCWDLEVTRTLELGEGVRHRVRVPTDATLTLGEGVSLRVAWVLESIEAPRTYRAGVLAPGETLLAEGLRARFAILDPYSGDNDGKLHLELLPPDTKASGLATPSSGAQYVPTTPTPAGTP